MRLIKQRIEKRDGSGTATLLPEEPEDMVIHLSLLSFIYFRGVSCHICCLFFFFIPFDSFHFIISIFPLKPVNEKDIQILVPCQKEKKKK